MHRPVGMYCHFVIMAYFAQGLQCEICHDYKMAIHAHRAMHAALDRNPEHGVSMLVLAKVCRMIGVDQIHVGTVLGKLVGSRKDIIDIRDGITRTRISSRRNEILKQNWGMTKATLPVSSGGLHPGIIPDVLKIMGNDIALLVSGGIHGHPSGTRAGATAAMQPINATMQNTPLREYATAHKELREALEKWGRLRPQ